MVRLQKLYLTQNELQIVINIEYNESGWLQWYFRLYVQSLLCPDERARLGAWPGLAPGRYDFNCTAILHVG